MMKLTLVLALAIALINLVTFSATATEIRDISSVSVLTDPRLVVPLSELSSLYTRKSMVTISNSFGVSENQEKRIEDGEAADLFITSNAELIRELRLKGMVDIHTIGRLASNHEVHYVAAVVASENMSPARDFLAFLKSNESREILKKNGLNVP